MAEPIKIIVSGATRGPAGAGSNLTIKDDGVQLPTVATSLNFVGAGVTASQVGNETQITIPGGGGTTGVTDPEIVRDTIAATLVQGDNVTITPDDAANTITIKAARGIEVKEEGVSVLALATSLSFVGAGVTAVHTSGGDVQVTVSGGGAPGVSTSAGTGILFTQLAGAVIDASVTWISTAGHSLGGIGTGIYIYDPAVDAAYTAANPQTSFRASDLRGFRLDTRYAIILESLGVLPDNVGAAANNLARLVAGFSLQLFTSQPGISPTQFRAGPTILVGRAKYHFSAALNIKYCVSVIGQATGADSQAEVSQFVFPADSDGIVLNDTLTYNDTTVASGVNGGSGAGSRIQGIAVIGGGGTNREKHALRIRTRCTVQDVFIQGFPGDGIFAHVKVGGGGFKEGNANGCYFNNISIRTGRDGVSLFDNDINASAFHKINVREAGACGFREEGTLGNSFKSLQVDSCGALQLGYVTYAGKKWLLRSSTAGIGGTTEPGTNDAVWYHDDRWPGFPTAPDWIPGKTDYRPSLAIYVKNYCPSTYQDIYVESYTCDMSLSAATGEGGEVHWTRDSAFITNIGTGGATSSKGFGFRTSVPYNDVRYTGNENDTHMAGGVGGGGDYTKGRILWWTRSSDYRSSIAGLRFQGSDLVWDHDNSGTWGRFNGPFTAQTHGKPYMANYGVSFNKFALRDPFSTDNTRELEMGAGIPTSGTYARGQPVFNVGAAPGGPPGWSCVQSGSIGTTAWTPNRQIYGRGEIVTNGGNTYVNVSAPPRLPNTAYAVGEVRSNMGMNFRVSASSGPTGSGTGPTGNNSNGNAYLDGGVSWMYLNDPTTAASGGPTGTDPNVAVKDNQVYWLYQPPFIFKPWGNLGA